VSDRRPGLTKRKLKAGIAEAFYHAGNMERMGGIVGTWTRLEKKENIKGGVTNRRGRKSWTMLLKRKPPARSIRKENGG